MRCTGSIAALIALPLLALQPGCASDLDEPEGEEVEGGEEIVDDGLELVDAEMLEEGMLPCDHLDGPPPEVAEMFRAQEDGTIADLEPAQAAASYHWHYVDWPNGARLGLCSTGRLMGYGTHLYMSSAPGRGCNGHWYVWVLRPGQAPEQGNWIRINALNGH